MCISKAERKKHNFNILTYTNIEILSEWSDALQQIHVTDDIPNSWMDTIISENS